MTKTIQLHGGVSTLVDDDDYARLKNLKIQKHQVSKGRYYACIRHSDYSRTYLHRFIVSSDKGAKVDHINGNALDNRKKNLRVCSQAENVRNSKKRTHSKQPYKGICNTRGANTWYARIRCGKKTYTDCGHATPELAAKSYDKLAKKMHGKFASLNWPEVES